MDENTGKYPTGLEYIFKGLKKDIEELCKISNISEKSRKIEYIKARSLFIKIINDKYGIPGKITFNKVLNSDSVRKLLGISRTDIYNYLKKFNSLLQYSSSFKAIYHTLQNKWIVGNKDFPLLIQQISELRKELELLNEKFDKIYKTVLI